MGTMRIEYQEITIQHVLDYFVKGFRMRRHEKITSYKWFYDAHKEVVVFRLFLEKEEVKRA